MTNANLESFSAGSVTIQDPYDTLVEDSGNTATFGAGPAAGLCKVPPPQACCLTPMPHVRAGFVVQTNDSNAVPNTASLNGETCSIVLANNITSAPLGHRHAALQHHPQTTAADFGLPANVPGPGAQGRADISIAHDICICCHTTSLCALPRSGWDQALDTPLVQI